MGVFAQVDAVGRKTRVQLFEGRDLLMHPVPAVVDQNGDVWIAIEQRAQKCTIALVADHDVNSRLRELFAFGGYVHADNSRLRPKIVTPHPKRAAVEHADFKQRQASTPKPGQMTMI